MDIIAIYHTIRLFMRKMRDDLIGPFSAQAAFFIILSFFPFAMFLLTLIQYIPSLSEGILLDFARKIMPDGLNSFIISIIREIFSKASGTVISLAAITALWSASKGFLAIVRGLNSVYEIQETRNYFKLRIICTFYTLVFAIALILTMVLLVFGNSIYLWIQQKIPVLNDLALILISLRTTLVLGVLVVFFTALYVLIPNRHSTIMTELPGAVISSAGWLGFSYLYSFYIENMGSYSYMYGSLTAIVLFMFWLYACMYIMFFGAEVNIFLRQQKLQHLFNK